MSLLTAYNATYQQMKPQIQGTCGIYSFWYATILLRHLSKTYPEVPLPRACHAMGSSSGPSMRHYAKHTIGSGQGELLNTAEIVALVTAFKYKATTYSRLNYLWGGREAFITEQLNANRPVLFAYICGTGPVTAATATGVAQDAYGPHWSLLIAESGSDYIYINPHKDNTTLAAQCLKYPKKTVLDSIDDVDDVKYDKFWKKVGKGKLARVGPTRPTNVPVSTPLLKTAVYDLGAADRQSLNNVLVAVG